MLPYQPAHDIPFFVHQVRLFVCLYLSMWDLQTNFYFFFSLLSVNQTPTRPQAEASGDIDEGETGQLYHLPTLCVSSASLSFSFYAAPLLLNILSI